MRVSVGVLLAVLLAAVQVHGEDTSWYSGDERCPPPQNDGKYSAPYNAQEHRQEFPVFSEADTPGWSCSYQREDGVIVQYGDSRTPQQQWLALWGDPDNN